jgi:hypothetical protein
MTVRRNCVIALIRCSFVQVVVLSWRQQWISFTLTELLDVAMIFHVGVTFSPLYEPLLIRAFDGSNGATTGATGGTGAGAGDAAQAMDALQVTGDAGNGAGVQ